MKCSVTAAGLMLTAFAIAQKADFNAVNTPFQDQVVTAGSKFPIRWEVPEKYRNEAISIELLSGATPDKLVPIKTLASGIDNNAGEFDWKVDEDLGGAQTYGVKFVLDIDPSIFQYSMPFKIQGDCPERQGSVSAPKTQPTPALAPQEHSFKNTTVQAPGGKNNGTNFRGPERPSSTTPAGPADDSSFGVPRFLPDLTVVATLIALMTTFLL